jgi:hypothetical protein
MTNLIKFDAKLFQFVDLKRNFSLNGALVKAEEQPSALLNPYGYIAINGFEIEYNKFIDKVVSTVKKTHFTTTDKTCSISLEIDYPSWGQSSITLPPSPDLSTAHLVVVAQALYRSFDIKIKHVDAMTSPRKIVVSWHRDHLMLNPSSPYATKLRKTGTLTDCTLKFRDKLFPAHKLILAAKSPYFETLFTGGYKEVEHGTTINVILDNLEERSVEILLDYLYTGELILEECSTNQIDNLVNFSSYYGLPHLKQRCFEKMCKNVNADNLKLFLQLARHYNHKQLEAALVDHVTKEVTLDNFEQLMELGKSENIENFAVYCLAGISKYIQKIDYEQSGRGESAELKGFTKLLHLAFKYSLPTMVNTITDQMRKVTHHPGYGTHLEKLIEYLALTCDYQSRSLPGNNIQTLKEELHKEVLEEIEYRDLRDTLNEWPLIERCLEITEKYHLREIKQLFIKILIKQAHKNLGSKVLDQIKKHLKIAEKYNLQELKKVCEAILEAKIFTDSYDEIVALANQFNLTQLKEICQKHRG